MTLTFEQWGNIETALMWRWEFDKFPSYGNRDQSHIVYLMLRDAVAQEMKEAKIRERT